MIELFFIISNGKIIAWTADSSVVQGLEYFVKKINNSINEIELFIKEFNNEH